MIIYNSANQQFSSARHFKFTLSLNHLQNIHNKDLPINNNGSASLRSELKASK